MIRTHAGIFIKLAVRKLRQDLIKYFEARFEKAASIDANIRSKVAERLADKVMEKLGFKF